MTDNKKIREPLLRITKRPSIVWWKAWIIRAVAILAGFLLGSLVIYALTDCVPVKVFKSLFDGTFGTERRTWFTLQQTAMLLCVSLAVTPAFKMRFWNIGAEGQVLIGALAAVTCIVYIEDMIPNWLLLLIMVGSSIVAGMIWALIPAFFKAKWNTNETLFTLMMNYIAMQLVSFMIMVWVPNGSSVLPTQEHGWLPSILDKKYLFSIIVVVVLAVLMFIYLKTTKHGYEIAVVGESENTAKYIGINVKKVILRTLAISGALCGIAGFLIVAGAEHTITKDTVGGNGFTAIIVSWMSKFNPLIMAFSSLLIVFLQEGSSRIAETYSLSDSISDIVTGIVLFFIIGCEFFISYKVNIRHLSKAAKEDK